MNYTSHKTTYTTVLDILVLPVLSCMTLSCRFYVTAQAQMMYLGIQNSDNLLTVLILFNPPYSNCMSAIQSTSSEKHEYLGLVRTNSFIQKAFAFYACLKSNLLTNSRPCSSFICGGHPEKIRTLNMSD